MNTPIEIPASYDQGIPALRAVLINKLAEINYYNEACDYSLLLHCTTCNYRAGPYKYEKNSDHIIETPFDKPSATIQVTHCLECLR